MTKYNAFKLRIYYDIEQILQRNDIEVKHIDLILNDFIIVETNDKDRLVQQVNKIVQEGKSFCRFILHPYQSYIMPFEITNE
ncbi:hypothetical protein KFZ58_18620 [Virgibacillus sp. NKC19-16]|uniref:hypothetical protein n=1 Tax=Virgibacillus salidurans TaxID=2831673 RepID=UPI001F207CA5|nr:hypothetical protein [Virgibacillus sp. NKC19-16]UJL46332.1 hypothetical protein KFZ58_18620 [Virgibacillus sp. NKC19-16]